MGVQGHPTLQSKFQDTGQLHIETVLGGRVMEEGEGKGRKRGREEPSQKIYTHMLCRRDLHAVPELALFSAATHRMIFISPNIHKYLSQFL